MTPRSARWPFIVLALASLGLVSPVAAGPGAGTDLSPSSNTWWIHADPDYGAWMSNVKLEGTGHYAGWGPNQPNIAPPGLGFITTTFALVPAPQEPISLDPAKKIAMEVWVGGGLVGQVYVAPILLVDGEVLASGEQLSGTFVDEGLLHFGWDLTARLETIPAGAKVEWQFRLSGAYESAFYWMEGDRWTSVTLPVVAKAPDDDAAIEAEGAGSAPAVTPESTSSTSTSTSARPSSAPASSAPPTATSSAPPAQSVAQEEADDGEAAALPKESPFIAMPLIAVLLGAVLALRRR